jgi:putative ribosome biogenesis GTPase RsgA
MCIAPVLVAADRFVQAQPNSNSQNRPPAKRIPIEGLVTAAPLPEYYAIGRQDILDGDEVVGHKLLLSRNQTVSKVIVQIETRKLKTREEKVAAMKSYLIGVTQSFHDAGLKVVEKKLPDIDKSDFKKRILIDSVYENPAARNALLVQMQVFFTDQGYTVLIISDNEVDHALLTKWARSVVPK